MKRIFYTLIFLLCFPVICHAMSPAILGGAGGAGAASCNTSTIRDSQQNGLTDYDSWGTASTTVKYSSRFQAGSSYNLCSLKIIMNKTDGAGTEPGVVTAYIYSDTGETHKPNSSLGQSSNTIAFAAMSTSCSENNGTFTFSTPVALTSGSYYHIVLKTASAGSATDNYRMCNYDTGAPGYTYTGYDTTWNQASTGQMRFKTYGQ